MDNIREIASFRRRPNKVGLTKEPPQISIDVWHEGKEPPAVKPWQLRIMIESQKPLALTASVQDDVIPQFPSVFCWFRSLLHALNVQVEHLRVFGVEKIQMALGIGNYMRRS